MRTAQPALACRVAQRPDLGEGGLGRRSLGEGGFTLVEFLIAAAIMTMVLGATVALSTQIQQAYGTQLDDAVVEQEARYALDWIARDLRSAGSLPYHDAPKPQAVWFDPNGGADDDDSIRVQADMSPYQVPSGPDGDIADKGENITIAFNALTRVITRQDTNDPVDATPVVMTEAIITDLSFTYLNNARVETADPDVITYVQIGVTAESRGARSTVSTLTTEVRLRTR